MKAYLLAFLFNLSIISVSYATDSLKIDNPWIPEAPPGATVMAGYMEIYNTSDQVIDIIDISSPAFSHVEMHLSTEINGMTSMLPQKKLSITAHGKLILKSGSYHLMLAKPEKRLLNGHKIQLNFTLSNGDKTSLMINIRKNKPRPMKCGAGKCGSM